VSSLVDACSEKVEAAGIAPASAIRRTTYAVRGSHDPARDPDRRFPEIAVLIRDVLSPYVLDDCLVRHHP
jgi:hypothetical protein